MLQVGVMLRVFQLLQISLWFNGPFILGMEREFEIGQGAKASGQGACLPHEWMKVHPFVPVMVRHTWWRGMEGAHRGTQNVALPCQGAGNHVVLIYGWGLRRGI